ncbi:MAG: 3-isopropylmalate dehydratase large subunit [Coriobacteriales bacterium]
MPAPMTIAEKILAAHAGLDEVVPGQLVECDVDVVHANDITAPIAIDVCRQVGNVVFDPARVALVPDHYTPNKDIKSAEQAKLMREFAREHGIEHYYEIGCAGIEHALLPEKGVIVPGDLTIGADSHTCTYGALGAFSTGMGSTDVGIALATGRAWFKVPESIKFVLEGAFAPGVSAKDLILHIIGMIGVDGALYQAMEFSGPAVAQISMDGRFTMCNMAIEAGAKTGIFAVDDVTRAYVESRAERPWIEYQPDEGARYARTIRVDLSQVEPTVSLPHLPSNTRAAACCNDLSIDQAVIGSCTNGRIEDMREAAAVLRGRMVAPGVRCIIIPATQDVYRQCMHEGLMDVFLDAHCAISTPTCGPCLGGHMGVLASGERCIATTNRNFVGRMGAKDSEVVLASPAVAAASAVAGFICTPEQLD